MRVNIYAEEMTDRLEIFEKKIEGQTFTGLRFNLALPASFIPADGGLRPATKGDSEQAQHMQAPFIHHPGDDDSSAVTFWGKRDLREVLKKGLAMLDAHYSDRAKAARRRKAPKKKVAKSKARRR